MQGMWMIMIEVDRGGPLILDLFSSDPMEGAPKGPLEGTAAATAASSTSSGPKVSAVKEDVSF
jgi:hypothetical protein